MRTPKPPKIKQSAKTKQAKAAAHADAHAARPANGRHHWYMLVESVVIQAANRNTSHHYPPHPYQPRCYRKKHAGHCPVCGHLARYELGCRYHEYKKDALLPVPPTQREKEAAERELTPRRGTSNPNLPMEAELVVDDQVHDLVQEIPGALEHQDAEDGFTGAAKDEEI
jgi:hypothetical protein